MSTMTAAPARTTRGNAHDIWRIVRLHAVNKSVFFGIPWIILGGAWVITLIITLLIRGATGSFSVEDIEGMRYSWAVLSPQWYLVVVGVQAVALTFSFALGFGTTRRDFWLGTSLMFVLVSVLYAVAIATLVQLEIATGGWWLGAHMFDALWYGQTNWLTDFFSTFSFQLFVLFAGGGATAVYMRWRVRGMMILLFSSLFAVVAAGAIAVWTNSWPAILTWASTLTVTSTFALLLVVTLAIAGFGYLVMRRATPR